MAIKFEPHWAEFLALADQYEQICERSLRTGSALPNILGYCSGEDVKGFLLLLEVESEYFKGEDLYSYLTLKYPEQNKLINDFKHARKTEELSDSVPGYELLSVVGYGAYGKVYRARKTNSGKLFAVKVARNPQGTRWLGLEKRSLSGLDHRGIVKCYDAGVCENGAGFLCLEFVEGQTLYSLVQHSGRLSFHSAVDYTVQILDSLKYLHSQNSFHGDLSPKNIIISDRGPVLIDFGFAVSRTAWTSDRETNSAFGTPGYRVNGTHLTKLTHAERDLFALLSILCFMLQGNALYRRSPSVHEGTSVQPDSKPGLVGNIPIPLARLFNFDSAVKHRHVLRSATNFEQFLQHVLTLEGARRRRILVSTAVVLVAFCWAYALREIAPLGMRNKSRSTPKVRKYKSLPNGFAENELDEATRRYENESIAPEWFLTWKKENSFEFDGVEAKFEMRVRSFYRPNDPSKASSRSFDKWLASKSGPVGQIVFDFGVRTDLPLGYWYQIGDLPWDYAMVYPVATGRFALDDQELWGWIRESHVRAGGPLRMRLTARHRDHEDINKRSNFVVAQREFAFHIKDELLNSVRKQMNELNRARR
ncbi:MAG: hypothetical protein Aurels2KO_56820 [Aureliella sp.]